jgi:hypothetical protein
MMKRVSKAEWDALPWKWKYTVVRASELDEVNKELARIHNRIGISFKFKVVSIFFDVSTNRYTAIYKHRSK